MLQFSITTWWRSQAGFICIFLSKITVAVAPKTGSDLNMILRGERQKGLIQWPVVCMFILVRSWEGLGNLWKHAWLWPWGREWSKGHLNSFSHPHAGCHIWEALDDSEPQLLHQVLYLRLIPLRHCKGLSSVFYVWPTRTKNMLNAKDSRHASEHIAATLKWNSVIHSGKSIMAFWDKTDSAISLTVNHTLAATQQGLSENLILGSPKALI